MLSCKTSIYVSLDQCYIININLYQPVKCSAAFPNANLVTVSLVVFEVFCIVICEQKSNNSLNIHGHDHTVKEYYAVKP